MSGNYKDLKAWQKALELTLDIYKATRAFPKEEVYGLTSQVRRAALSMPSNIAEGKGRSSDKEFVLFLCHARGSLLEVETQLIIARELNYLANEQSKQLLNSSAELGRILNGLINSLDTGTRAKPA